jgi:hypothetical protein
VGAELLHADGQTDGRTNRYDKANSCTRNFDNAPKKADPVGRAIESVVSVFAGSIPDKSMNVRLSSILEANVSFRGILSCVRD